MMKESGSQSLNDVYDLIGGLEVCPRLSEIFHQRVLQDPVLRKMFPKNTASLNEHFALFLGERFGGPPAYTAKRGKQSLLCRHAHLSISTEEADRWLGHICAVIEDVGIVEPTRSRLRKYFIDAAKTLTDPFIPLYDLRLDELREQITVNPELLQASSMGHSLLRNAVCRWDAPRVRLLLESGASASVQEPLGHQPLYRAANSVVPGGESEGVVIIQLLVKHGGDVNWQSGPGKSTPLHMAARRGNVLLAESLVTRGADIEGKDAKGESPLRRAVNCGQEQMVHFLLSSGANPLSRDKLGRTPADVARHDRIRDLLGQANK